eukprot:jgi/Ulvmu1/11794/UM080_0005.1
MCMLSENNATIAERSTQREHLPCRNQRRLQPEHTSPGSRLPAVMKAQTLGIAVSAVLAVTASASEATGTDILNFALNLECLEAEFYSYAAFGRGLTEAQRGGGPAPVGGRKASLSPELQSIAEEIAADEIAHVEFLRTALGDAAVPCPAIDIGPAFIAAANAAAGATLSPDFDPYANDIFFLHGAFIFEDVGVTAYRGAVAPLTDLVDGETLSAAAAILAVEAYHAGAIRALLLDLVNTATETPFGPVANVVELISDLRDSVDGPDDLDQGVIDGTYGEANIVPTDASGLVYSRSVDQVLAIVYLGGESAGGFFPEGIATAAAASAPTAACEGICEYRVTVNMEWSPESHPVDFPMDPMGFFSPFFTVTHDQSFVMWRQGEESAPGIQQIAETGMGDIFLGEVEACGDSCGEPIAIECAPMSGVCNGTGIVIATAGYPYFSIASMLAPSPDWFTGLDSWPLCKDGEWIEGMSQPVNAYDAGTDVGPSFTSPDMPNSVPGEIFSFGGVMPGEASIFYNPATGSIPPLGTISVELIGCM